MKKMADQRKCVLANDKSHNNNEMLASDDVKMDHGITRRDFVKYSVGTAACVYLGTLNTGCGGGNSTTAVSGTPPAPLAAPISATAWSFAVMADTQWLGDDDGKNPETVSVGIINQLNAEFIKHGVDFVVQVGDLTLSETQKGINIRATYAQALYNAGIGFFPIRGNHEPTAQNAVDFVHAFHQTTSGMHNTTPADVFVSTDDDDSTKPISRYGAPFQIGKNFSSPSSRLQGLSYAFDVNNVRLVMLDQYTPADGGTNSIASQQDWLGSTLSNRPAGSHALVFTHQGLICPYQPDALFGDCFSSTYDAMFAAQDQFITSLHDNGVRYHIFGHDHFHERSTATTTDGSGKKVTEVFCAPSANELFVPQIVKQWYDPVQYPNFNRSIQSQQVNNVGYYIYTVDGNNLAVEYYGADVTTSNFQQYGPNSSWMYISESTPNLTFVKRETFGYSQAGKEFTVPQSGAFNVVSDIFNGMTAKILGGINTSQPSDYNGLATTRTITTGWQDGPTGLLSPILYLWGMELLGSDGKTDTYTLSIQYNPNMAGNGVVANNWLALATPINGVWANAVERNTGGTRKFIRGPWVPAYGLGTYGFDPAASTAWAVINYNAAFAVVPLS
jgi:hypothetical protein